MASFTLRKHQHIEYGNVDLNSSSNLASKARQTYTATKTVPAGSTVSITGVSVRNGHLIYIDTAQPQVTVSGTTATFSVTVSNYASSATMVRVRIYYAVVA